MRAFESKNPDISSSERTKNVKSKTILTIDCLLRLALHEG